jgi:transcriptional regulator with XRE-family HTH domain
VCGKMVKSLGEYIHRLRRARKLTVRGLASTAQVDPTWLSRLEHDRYGSPGAARLYRLARALDVEVHDFYVACGYEDEQPGLPGFAPYLRAKYDLPDDAIQQLEAHFELINAKYQSKQGDHHDQRHNKPT